MEQLQHKHMHRRKTPSFSSSLLDAIYRSIDDPKQFSGRRGSSRVEHEVESLRRAIRIEKNYTAATPRPHPPSNSGSSTDSSLFSSSEAESSSSARNHPKRGPEKVNRAGPTAPKREGRLTRALKIYGDLKKAKEPGSPSGRIASFLNSIFSPRRNKRPPEGRGPVRKSRSMKDGSSSSSSAAAESCLNRNPISKSTRTFRFCHVSVVLNEDSRPGGPRAVGGGFVMKKDVDVQDEESDVGNDDDDDRSCASSDLFELENIGRVGVYGEELPVYGTTSVKMNRAIAGGLMV